MKNSKKIISALICTALLSSTAVLADTGLADISFVVGANTISVNGSNIDIPATYIVDGTTLVPLRVISEGLGAEVNWSETDSTVSVYLNNSTISLTIGSTAASINGESYELLAAPELKDNTAMVPIRFISEALGANVGWEQATMTVTISEKSNANQLAQIDNTKWSYNEDDNVYWQIGISYCASPADTQYEALGIFVPGDYMTATANGDGTYTCLLNTEATVNGYTSSTAPIVIPVNTPGYSSMKAPTAYVSDAKSYTDSGFIYVNAGCRGRDEGAPAGVTDLKAAIKYIRYNEGNVAGDTDRIFSFGMSGGGAQSALLGATGDSELYTPYLNAIGAADGYSDAVAGSMCWCPITSLDIADEAYEWNMGVTRTDLTDEMQTLSDNMAAVFGEYINELELKDESGNVLALTQTEDGSYLSGSYYDYIKNVIETSLNNFLSDTAFPYTPASNKGGGIPGGGNRDFGTDNGNGNHMDTENMNMENMDFEAMDGINRLDTDSSEQSEAVTYNTAEEYIASLNGDNPWITYDSETNTASISSVEAFVKACKNASKSVGAFDDLNKSQGENTLFGYSGEPAHFDSIMADLLKDNTEYGAAYAEDLAKTDELGNSVEYRMNMYNPLYYLNDYYSGNGTSTVAKYWRIRTGINQGDTSLSTEVNLALALQNAGYDVDFETVWGQGHTMAERTGSSTDNFIAWVNDCLK